MLRVVRNPPLDESLAEALVRVWVAVTNAGGAVGFVAPVTAEEIRPTAEEAIARVHAGRDDLVVALESDVDAGAEAARGDGEEEVAGFAFLATNEWRLARHWARVQRLQRHPVHRGRGIGGKLLAEVEAAAADRGLERLVLTVRGGTGREGFYLDRGFSLDARLPGRLRTAAGDVEELHLSKLLGQDDRVTTTGTLRLLRLDPELPTPAYAQPGDAGLDLYAREAVTLGPGERAVVPTGVAVAVPPGCVGLVHPRSGLAAHAGVSLLNAPGTIDAGYRGEVSVVLINHDRTAPVGLSRGDRVAQLVIQRVETVRVVEAEELPPASRDTGGFGSTGR